MKGVGISSGRTRWFGINLSASGFGVFSVWMKIVREPRGANEGAVRDVASTGREVLDGTPKALGAQLVCALRAA